MKDKKIFLRKVRTAAMMFFCFVVVTAIGVVCCRQAFTKEALAAAETNVTNVRIRTEAKKNAVEFELAKVYEPFGKQSSGDLLTAATHKILGEQTETEAVDEEYKVISTGAIAKSAMEKVEQETLELMASPAGSVWGGMIKVFAGETPLLITEEDKEVLLRIVEAEATCEDVMGRMLVANVILNRVVSKKFPNSIAEVVFQNNGVTYQFAPIKDGRYWTVEISDKTREAVERVLAGEDYSQGALYFAARKLANKKAMSWFDSDLKYLFKHGVHEFFTDK